MKPQLKPIRTKADYQAALKAAEAIFDAPKEPAPNSELGAYFEALTTLIEAYERKHYPIGQEPGAMNRAPTLPLFPPAAAVYS